MINNRFASLVSLSMIGLCVAAARGQDLDTLIKQAGDPDAKIRNNANEKLIDIGAPAVGPLVKLIADADAPIANAARVTLCDLTLRAGKPPAAAREAVSQALADAYRDAKDPNLRNDLARFLGYIGHKEAVPVLAAALNDNATREPARRALAANPSPHATTVLRAWLSKETDPQFLIGIINALSDRQDRVAQPRLIELTRDPDEQVRLAAVDALARIPDHRLAAVISRVVSETEGRARSRAENARHRFAETLFAAGRQKAAEAIYAALLKVAQTDHWRSAAIVGLGKVGGPKAIPRIMDALESKSRLVRGAVVAALESLPDEGAVEAITMQIESASPGARCILLSVLAKRGQRAGLSAAVKALKDDDPDVRVAALHCVGTLGDASAVKPLLDALPEAQGPERDAAEQAIGQLARSATPALIDALAGATPPRRAAIYRAISARRDPRVLETLLAGTKDDDPVAQLGAIEALGFQSDPKILDVLMETAKSKNGAVHAAALRSALRLSPRLEQKDRARALATYHDALNLARKPDQQHAALGHIARLADPKSLDIVKPLLRKGPLGTHAADAVLAIAPKLADDRKDEAVELVKKAIVLNPGSGHAQQAVVALRKWGVDIDLARRAGFVTVWSLVGPFPNPDGQMWKNAYPPENAVDLTQTYNVGDKKLAWKKYHTPDPQGIVDCAEAVAKQNNVGAYANAEVTADQDRDVLFKIGSDDQVACWLNGKQIHANKASRAVAPDQDTIKTRLNAGKNRILIKVLNDGGPWGFCLRITNPDGKPLKFTQPGK